MVITLLIAFFKKENNCTLEDDHVKLNVIQNYLLLWKIIKLPNIQKLALAMFTIQVQKKPNLKRSCLVTFMNQFNQFNV